MKRNWLRGVLLGLSLAALLGGGVALAQGMFFTANKECVECWRGREAPSEDRYLMELAFGGWNHELLLCQSAEIDGEVVYSMCGGLPPMDPFSVTTWWPCERPIVDGSTSLLGLDVDVSQPPTDPLGEWVLRIWQENPPGTVIDSAGVTFLVAEVCEVGFVPEPGTLLLLGSGLAGLAGYTALRWRTRE